MQGDGALERIYIPWERRVRLFTFKIALRRLLFLDRVVKMRRIRQYAIPIAAR